MVKLRPGGPHAAHVKLFNPLAAGILAVSELNISRV